MEFSNVEPDGTYYYISHYQCDLKGEFMISCVLSISVKVFKDKYASQVPDDTSCYKCLTVLLLVDSLQ